MTRGARTADAPAVLGLETAVYVVPTDAPEADGTLAWDETTMLLVTARAGGEQGIGWSDTAAAAQSVVTDVLAGVIIGRNALDVAGAAAAMARGGILTPDAAVPGLGMELRAADAERYRRG
jgi:hypothetical protein